MCVQFYLDIYFGRRRTVPEKNNLGYEGEILDDIQLNTCYKITRYNWSKHVLATRLRLLHLKRTHKLVIVCFHDKTFDWRTFIYPQTNKAEQLRQSECFKVFCESVWLKHYKVIYILKWKNNKYPTYPHTRPDKAFYDWEAYFETKFWD